MFSHISWTPIVVPTSSLAYFWLISDPMQPILLFTNSVAVLKICSISPCEQYPC